MLDSEFRFKIVEEKFGSDLSYTLLDSDTGEFVTILPSLGGAINRMGLRKDNELIEILDGYADEEDVQKNLTTSFKGSNLFPFPNRIRDGKYSFVEQAYQLPLNFPQESNSIHGLVYDKQFRVVDKEDGEIGCLIIIEYSPKESKGYPFNCLFKVVYALKEGTGFECRIKVSNLMDRSIPVGHGWHPYFTARTEKIDDLWLQFPSKTTLEVDKQNIPTGKKEPYHEFNRLTRIGDTKLDNCFELKDDERIAEINILNKDMDFGFTIWQETGKYKYNFLQVYTPPHRKSIAIEPMTCAPDAFNNKDGLIVLGPFESFYAVCGIKHTLS